MGHAVSAADPSGRRHVLEDAGADGPLAPPGVYSVRLTVDDRSLTQEFELRADPRINATDEQLQEQFRLLLAIRDRLSQTHATANRIAALRDQLATWSVRADASELQDDVDALDAALADIEAQLIQRASGLTYAHPIQLNAKLAALAAVVGSADGAPTQSAREVFANLSAQLDGLVRATTTSWRPAWPTQPIRAGFEVPLLSA